MNIYAEAIGKLKLAINSAIEKAISRVTCHRQNYPILL